MKTGVTRIAPQAEHGRVNVEPLIILTLVAVCAPLAFQGWSEGSQHSAIAGAIGALLGGLLGLLVAVGGFFILIGIVLVLEKLRGSSRK